MAETSINPLLSTKPSDSNLSASIHPLVLLTVSDQITRQQVRAQKGPIVGALLGQLHGRLVTAEYAFPCKVLEDTEGQWLLDQKWMAGRIQQFKDVHKVPALEVTGLYTLCPETGPTAALVPIQRQAIKLYNESSILLTVHPSAIASAHLTTADGKLPVSVYEGIIETDSNEDSSMQVDGEAASMLFRHIPYSVDTDETEMIAINYVAKGAGNAAAGDDGEREESPVAAGRADKKGKKKADTGSETKLPMKNSTKNSADVLTPHEDDQIASLTTRLNSVRMLQSRLSLLSKFLQQQPPSSLSDASESLIGLLPDPSQLPHLRNIQALLTRLNLLTPKATTDTLGSTSHAQHSDVQLSQLLALLGQDIQGMGEMGRKFATVDGMKQNKKANKGFVSHGQADSFGQEMEWDQPLRRGEGYSMAPF